MEKNQAASNPRVIVIQKLYSHYLNKDSELYFPKHRYKKFIRDVVKGTIERKDLIQNLIDNELKNHINIYMKKIKMKKNIKKKVQLNTMIC